MIISHSKRFIFFAVPKTATHAVRQVLRTHMEEGDWEQQMLFGKQALPIPELAALGHGHLNVAEVQPHLPAEQWHGYTKIAFVRNPYDRFISVCAFLNRDNPGFKENSINWMKAALNRPQFRSRLLVRPQYLQLKGTDGQSAMDEIGRYEDLQSSLDRILASLGLDSVQLEVVNRSEHAHYQQSYDDELREMVRQYYAQDLAVFDYQF
ncbi:MAG: sulfotransferase family 2 domain-containing protein [Pseudomonadota bacterium]